MNSTEYIQRREILKNNIGSGIILLPGNVLMPMNYASNCFPFRQDSTLLYYSGIDIPDIALIIDCDKNKEILFGAEADVGSSIWTGPVPSLVELAEQAGIQEVLSPDELKKYCQSAFSRKKAIHFLPPYTDERRNFLSFLLQIPVDQIEEKKSIALIKNVVSQRIIKSKHEIKEIEEAMNLSGEIHIEAMQMAVNGTYEYEIIARMTARAILSKTQFAYPVICTVHGEFLHNTNYSNQLNSGKLLLIDAGVESPLHYASDITRTIPVDGKFTLKQEEVYKLVLSVQKHALESITPGIQYNNLHMQASIDIVCGLIDIGLMRGNPDEAVQCGAHALFFPHGLGHALGLDVHDMEDLGEEYVGYSDTISRSKQFGTSNLRFARELVAGNVLTVEPGIYFIPLLIDLWEKERKHEAFINYSKLNEYRDFGGIRIEDTVLVLEDGNRILGNPIPKSISGISDLF